MPMVGSHLRLLAASLAARAAHGSCGAARSCPAELGGPPSEDGAVQLLQRTARLAAVPDEVVSPALARAMPIKWVHVPKCGSSFLNTLLHLPQMCDSRIPADLVVDSEMAGRLLREFKQTYDVQSACPGLMDTRFGHRGIESDVGYSRGAGHFMIMLREPEQRIISAYHDIVQASADEPRGTIMDARRSWGGWDTAELPALPDFAWKSRGCATRMLTRGGVPCGFAGGPPSDDEVAMAKRRLREGFAFVGLTDQWDLSMCLFDAMFKTGCHSYQFHNARPGRRGHDAEDEYDTAQLRGVTDPYDGEVFAEARRIFDEHLHRYNVSDELCAACYRQAGIVD